MLRRLQYKPSTNTTHREARVAQHLHALGPVDDERLVGELHGLAGVLRADHRQLLRVTALQALEDVPEHVVHHYSTGRGWS